MVFTTPNNAQQSVWTKSYQSVRNQNSEYTGVKLNLKLKNYERNII